MSGECGDLKNRIKNLSCVKIDDKEIFLLGTAHVSLKSVEDVTKVIEEISPDTVCVELCEQRYNSIINKKSWENMDIFRVIKERKTLFLLMQLLLAFLYQKVGKKLRIRPGAEMSTAIEEAQKINAHIELVDRDVNVTLKRTWRALSFWEKIKLFFYLITGSISVEKITSEDVENLKKQDQINKALEEIGRKFPKIKRIIVDERDMFLAQKIKNAPGKKVVAVVGAGHINGILKNLKKDHDINALLEIPPAPFYGRLIKWTIPLLILGIIAVGFIKGGRELTLSSLYVWIVVNGSLSALGAVISLAHPITVLSAFLAAPITSLNPAIAAGWVAGLVQAWIRKPTVKDLQNLPTSLSSVKGFWKNSFCKVLLVTVLTNLGSAIGTFVAGSWIIGKLLN